MKVGVLIGDKQPEEGGGYTFETEILQSFAKLYTETKHTFVILSQAKTPPRIIRGNHIQFLSLHRSWGARAILRFQKTVIAFIKKLRDPERPFKIAHWSEPIILRSGVDVIWHLTPTWLTAEVPAIVVVWELQHRLQPYFPEVSAGGEWDRREQSCRSILQRAAVIITGLEAGKAEIERFYQIPSERIKLLPHPTPGYALAAHPNDDRHILQKYSISENYIFYPAQFMAHKNHAGLLLALRLLRDQHNLELHLALAGSDRGNQSDIRQMVKYLDLVAQVHFLGFVTADDLIGLYRKAFCLAYVTFCGPENLPPLEAFALSCPVVASRVAGAQEQLGDAALLVDPKKPEEIAQAIKSLWKDAALRQILIHRGLERATKFTGEDFVKGVFAILDEFEPIRRSWGSTPVHWKVKNRIRRD